MVDRTHLVSSRLPIEGLGTATWLSTRGVLVEESSAGVGRKNFASQAECREEWGRREKLGATLLAETLDLSVQQGPRATAFCPGNWTLRPSS